MQENEFDWTRLFYPNLFNPLCWLLMIYFLPSLFFTSWWKTEHDKEDSDIVEASLDCNKFKKTLSDYRFYFLLMVLNSYWYDKHYSICYIDYLKEKWFSQYRKGDERRIENIKKTYNGFINLKYKRNRKKNKNQKPLLFN